MLSRRFVRHFCARVCSAEDVWNSNDEVISLQEKEKRISRLQICLQENENLSYSSFSFMIKEFALRGDEKMVDDLQLKMEAQGLHQGKHMLTFLITQAVQDQNGSRALSLLQKYNNSNIDPDPHPYTPILKLLMQQKKIEDAKSLWTFMDQRNIRKDELTYHYMIQGYISYSLFVEAFELIEEMIQSNIPTKSTSYFLWCSAIVRNGNFKIFIKLWDLMKDNRIAMNTSFYNLAFRAHSQSNWLNRMNALVKEMEKENISLDQSSYQYLIRAFLNGKRYKKVNYLIAEMDQKGISVTGQMFMDIIKLYCATNQGDKMTTLLLNVPQHSIPSKCWLLGISTVAHYHSKRGDKDNVYECFYLMENMKLQIDSVFVLGVITGFISSGHLSGAEELINKYFMIFDKPKAAIIHNQMAQKYSELNQLSCCLSSIQAILSLGESVTMASYVSLLMALSRANQVESQRNVADFLKVRFCNPSLNECLLLVDTFVSCKMHDVSRYWIDYMCTKDMYPSTWYKEDADGNIGLSNKKRKLGARN